MREGNQNRLIDLTGKTFDAWTVMSRGTTRANGGKSTMVRWQCRCACGTEREIDGGVLRRGRSKSCGCQTNGMISSSLTRHGHAKDTGSPTYLTWRAMLARCRNPRDRCWKNYGGRGIGVCERWERFEDFLADMGERPPGLTLDRRDNDKGYTKDNCRWATSAEQAANRSK